MPFGAIQLVTLPIKLSTCFDHFVWTVSAGAS